MGTNPWFVPVPCSTDWCPMPTSGHSLRSSVSASLHCLPLVAVSEWVLLEWVGCQTMEPESCPPLLSSYYDPLKGYLRHFIPCLTLHFLLHSMKATFAFPVPLPVRFPLYFSEQPFKSFLVILFYARCGTCIIEITLFDDGRIRGKQPQDDIIYTELPLTFLKFVSIGLARVC